MFFESHHSMQETLFTLRYMRNLDFPMHLHRSFEYVEQLSGSTEITISHQKHVLNPGDAVLIFPLQPHSYGLIENGNIRICIFSPNFVAQFYKSKQNKLPENNKFQSKLPQTIPLDNICHKKALTYFICGEFDRDRKYVDTSAKSEDQILVQLLLFSDKNFRNRCLLRDAASSIGYDYAYISKLFKRKVGISFRQYVNNLRIIESKPLLTAGDKSIEEIAELCGFSSLRAFDREFLNQVGVTPSNYQKQT